MLLETKSDYFLMLKMINFTHILAIGFSKRYISFIFCISFYILFSFFININYLFENIFLSFTLFSKFLNSHEDNSIFYTLFKNLKDQLKDKSLSIEEKRELVKELRNVVSMGTEVIKEQKEKETKEQKLAERRRKAAEKQQKFSSSLYDSICSILGYDLKDKIKSFNPKWISIKSKPTISINEFQPNYFTYDLECYLDEQNSFVPYQFGIYNPDINYKSFYGHNCVIDALKFILNSNYNTSNVIFYAHNAGKFDALFLIKVLTTQFNIDKISTLKDKNNAIFFFEFSYNGYNFKFKDSFKILPFGLHRLLTDFNINVNGLVGKLPFNHSWMNKNRVFYSGPTPDWLTSIDLSTIYVIKDGIFYIERYCYHYNKIDCVALHKLIYEFYFQLVKDFNIDFSYCITLPQLSMEVFRTIFLKGNKVIRLLSNRHYNFFLDAYKGANVSVYKPYGEKLYAYDVNSLYPYCMLKDMPVGTPRPYNIENGLNSFFGIAYAKVSCPNTLKIPVLPLKTKINGVEKLIFPTGTFNGTFFSEELKYAAQLGYKITLLKAYSFQRDKNLFKDYVDLFYNKKSNGKGAVKATAKLFLNSLYGRFAMQKDFDFNLITQSNQIKNQIINVFTNINPIPLSFKSVLFSFNLAPSETLKKSDPILYDLLTKHYLTQCETRIGNIAIAAAITAYARCEIDKYKRLSGLTCYYSDTDCVHLNGPLPKHMIGNELGMMKNELADNNYTIENDAKYFYKKGLFLRDKVYSIILQDGSERTKFSGLNRKFIPKNCFNILYNTYVSGNTIKMSTQMLRRNIDQLDVSMINIEKIFSFSYDKRLRIYNSKGLWVDTVPINITTFKKSSQDLTPIIRKAQAQIYDDQKKSDLEPFLGTLNQANICNNKNKDFDGYFLNYNKAVNSDSLTVLNYLIDKAINEGVLVPGVHFLISEHYLGKVNTISYMTNFISKQDILNIYQQHLDYILNSGVSGKVLYNEESGYIIDGLTLRIRIPNELKPESSPSLLTRIKKVFSKT